MDTPQGVPPSTWAVPRPGKPGLDQRRLEVTLELGPAPEAEGRSSGSRERLSRLLSHPDPVLHYLGFLPVVDGDFLPDDPLKLYANTADVDYIAGVNNMDGHIFASIDMPAINKDKQKVTE